MPGVLEAREGLANGNTQPCEGIAMHPGTASYMAPSVVERRLGMRAELGEDRTSPLIVCSRVTPMQVVTGEPRSGIQRVPGHLSAKPVSEPRFYVIR